MITVLSLLTSVKDYIEIAHKLVETNASSSINIPNYTDFGALLTYCVLIFKESLVGLFTFRWIQNLGSLPVLIPDISSAMLSEISVLDGYFHNAFTFLETRVSYGDQNLVFYSLEKFTVGFINSLFLFLPTSTAHIITLRRFVMQGLEAGYLAGLGTLAGNILWIGSIVFGLRFIVIPWLSFDVFRYGLGFLLLINYMWDSYNERRTVIEDVSKQKIFLLNFLLALTEQATIYPFLSNLSIGSDTTFFESFPTVSLFEYSIVHWAYLGGLVLGSFTLLKFTCWFWENPAFNIYMWAVSSLKLTTTLSQKFVNLFFLYLTMFFAVSNLSYFGLDYTLSHPLGFVHEDRLVDQKGILETSFLNTKASDRNTRRNRGRHGRRERWKRRVRRYRTFDVSLYDQGIYDLFTIEDLNYGFDRFWLRRKIRNHRVRFRFFPGPWMRSFKKQLARPRLESFMGPRVEFFRILFEQAYHPEFHEFKKPNSSYIKEKNSKASIITESSNNLAFLKSLKTTNLISFYTERYQRSQTENLVKEHSALRKFVRKALTRSKAAQVINEISPNTSIFETSKKPIYSKRWKEIFSKISHKSSSSSFQQTNFNFKLLNRFYEKNFNDSSIKKLTFKNYFDNKSDFSTKSIYSVKNNAELLLSKKDRQILRYKTFLNQKKNEIKSPEEKVYQSLSLFHPLKYYLQKEKGFQKKLNFYGAALFRKFGIENNAPYYRVMMKKFFYYYKPTLRWERTLRTATMRKARRKGPRIPRKLNTTKKVQMLATQNSVNNVNDQTLMPNHSKTEIQRPTHFYSLVSKRATRYRYQIYKDVLQHWYYSPFNRLLLKFDVDSFIRRQPKSHFLTKNEENALHLKRFLLADYYNTLRWYGSMENYNVMKQKIGKTKSFANTAYNQQFFGTFKKIRHLFAITPSLNEVNILKFDQPLFNEYSNSEKRNNENFSLYNTANIHEELLADEELYFTAKSIQDLPQDLSNQSSTIIKKYLKQATPIRKDYITKLLKDGNYSELMNFLVKGQKIRGNRPITNEKSLFDQEKNYLLLTNEQENRKKAIEFFFNQKLKGEYETLHTRSLWLDLMKKSQNLLYDQEALKRYISNRVEKLEKQKRRQEKMFKTRLETMNRWVSLPPLTKNNTSTFQITEVSGLTTALQKAIKEGIYYHLFTSKSGPTTSRMEKSNLRNNRLNILTNLPLLEQGNNELKVPKNFSLKLKQHLNARLKTRALQTLKSEQKLKLIFASLKNSPSKKILETVQPNILNKIFTRTLFPFKQVSVSMNHFFRSLAEPEKFEQGFQPVKQIIRFFIQPNQKTLNNWKRKETVFSARKKIRRKIYRVLDQKRQVQKRLNTTELENLNEVILPKTNRQKNDSLDWKSISRRQKAWTIYETSIPQLKNNLNKSDVLTKRVSTISTLFEKTFKRKRTRSRRYRRFKGRGPIKKHTLAEKLKRQFKLLKRYGEKQQGQDKKMEVFQMITKKVYNPDNVFEPRTIKQRRTRQSKHRYWKKHKRQKYLQLKRKQRKRRRYTVSKLRVLNKQFKRIRGQLELKNWWWKHFLPNFIVTNEAFWEIEKTQKIKDEISNLSVNEILKRDKSFYPEFDGILQVGNQDYKPLIFPETLRLREKLIEKAELKVNIPSKTVSIFGLQAVHNKVMNKMDSLNHDSLNPVFSEQKTKTKTQKEQNIFSNLTNNIFDSSQLNVLEKLEDTKDSKKLVSINPIPFYAGWDENLRQFVVTNRLLSRKDAGYSIDSNLESLSTFSKDTSNSTKIMFTKAPLLGMNAATTLYWQIPFTTYDPDQFFALGMDGFSPLGWRFFNFKHSKQTTKPMCIKNIYSRTKKLFNNQSLFSYNLQLKMLDSSFKGSFSESNKISKNQTRKIQKRQKRVKKHPRPPVWFPAGPLSNQILPVHYIYVFYKRTRLPRDRYIGRRLRRSDDIKASFLKLNFTRILDFTLRKRVKPIRKYHRKVFGKKNEEKNLLVRRRPFKEILTEPIRFRPMSKTRLASDATMLNASLLKTIPRPKSLKTKQTSENLRIRQLRRRIQRQVLRPIWRYKPRPGGIVWPGDYLRFELIKAPILNDFSTQNSKDNSNLNVRKKKRRNIQEWQIQPKKYLLQKHNLKVLQKRLQKSENLINKSQKIKELKLTF